MTLEQRLDLAERDLRDLLNRAPSGVRPGYWSTDISLAQYRVEQIKQAMLQES